jgi:formylglycine-generating enzyme required for sulfatase activity
VQNPALRAAIIGTGLAWRVRHTASQIEMVLVPPGSFIMGCTASGDWACLGDELPNHQVTLPTGFYLGRCEVTQTQWTSVMGSNPSNGQGPNFPNAAVCPVEMVSWNSVQSFMAAMDLRLPTEAEWEHAYRAGTTTAFHSSPDFPFGSNNSPALGSIAWWAPNAWGKMQPVGSKSANALGLFDMSGNAAEWVNDWYSASYYSSSSSVNPTGPASGATKVIRGGSYLNNFDRPLRSSARYDRAPGPEGAGQDTGFRVARNP